MNEDYLIAGSYSGANITQEQNENYTKEFSAITEEMADAMKQGFSPDSDEMQSAVAKHYEFILQFWTPDKAAYKSLAMNYVVPSGYNEYYEQAAEGLASYVYSAVSIWADKNL